MSDDFDPILPPDLPDDPDELVGWLEERGNELTQAELDAISEYAREAWLRADADTAAAWEEASGQADVYAQAGAGNFTPTEIVDAGINVGGNFGPVFQERQAEVQRQKQQDEDERQAAERQAALDRATEAAASVWRRTPRGNRPDMSSVEDLVPSWLTPEEAAEFVTEATTEGHAEVIQERAQEARDQMGASDDEALEIAENQTSSLEILNAAEPDWLLRFNQANGGMLTEQQKQRYLDYWNDAYGTFLRDFDTDLAPILAGFDGTEAEVQNFASAVMAAQEPQIAAAITLPLVQGERKVTYTQEELDDLRAMGYSNDAITRLVRLAGITAGDDAIRPGALGDTLRVGPLAALTRYYGGMDDFARFDQATDDIAKLEQQMGLQPGEFGRMTIEERRALRKPWQAIVDGLPLSERRDSDAPAKLEAWDQAESLLRSQGIREDRGPTPGILGAQSNFRRGLERYRGDELLALVHAVDPTLAENVAASGGDPDKLDWQDNAAVYDILERSGVIEGSNVRLRQLESATGFFGYFQQGRGAQGGGGGAGRQRRVVDPVAVKEQVQQLWSRMFLADVDDATVQAITANLQKQLDDAPDGMSFDVSSRIMAFLRGTDVYDEMYRNKPEGLSEEEFQAQFAAGVQDVLGNELDPEALRTGMRTGDYQAAVGRAAASDKLLTNSTLRGRWAQAKQTLDRFS